MTAAGRDEEPGVGARLGPVQNGNHGRGAGARLEAGLGRVEGVTWTTLSERVVGMVRS